MNRKPQSLAEAETYRLLRVVLTDLRKAERALATSLDKTPPDPEQAASLAALRATIARLHLVFTSQN